MKWSSSSNSSLSNGNIVTMALNNSSNNNSSISSSGSNTYSSLGQNGSVTRTTAATVRRHASDRRSIFYTDPSDMEIFLKNHNNKKVRCIALFIQFTYIPLRILRQKARHSLCSNNIGYCFSFRLVMLPISSLVLSDVH